MTAVDIVSTSSALMSHLEGLKLSSSSDDNRLTPQCLVEIVDSLKLGGFEQIEQQFRAAEEQRPTVKHDSYAEIPVVDLSRAAAEADVVSKQLGDAACQWGIFQIVNHGISAKTMHEVEAHGRNFFQYPTERKLRLGKLYDPVGADNPANSLHWAEMVLLKIDPALNKSHESEISDNVLELMWPEGNTQLRDAVATFTSAVKSMNEQVLRLFAQYWGLKEDFFTQHFDHENFTTSSMRWNYYPRCPKPFEILGANEHTDPFSLTFLMQDKVGGLQIRRADQWYGVRPIEGALVVNVGDSLHAWTNGRFKSVYHRAVLNDQVDRISLATFVYPHIGAPISAADELVDGDHPRVFKPFLYEEFWNKSIEARARALKLGTRVNDGVRMLDAFRIQE